LSTPARLVRGILSYSLDQTPGLAPTTSRT
jgi:hypothetical protein